MKFGKYLLVVVDYDSETLEAHSLEDIGEVHRHFTEEVADKIIKCKKYKGAFEEAILLEVDVDSYFKDKSNMEKLLVKYHEDFGRMGNLDGLFICTKTQLESIKNLDIYFGEVLGKHSEVTTNDAYYYCEIVSEDQDLIHDLLTVFVSNNISGYNPLDYVEDESEE